MFELAGIAWLIPSRGELTVFRKIIPDLPNEPVIKSAPVNFILKKTDKKFRELIDENKLYLDWDLSPKFLAELMKIPMSHLNYYMNEVLKVSLRDLLNEYRVDYACNLLEKMHEDSILKIAYDSGFKSKATFNRVFKNIKGLTPQEFREKFFQDQGNLLKNH